MALTLLGELAALGHDVVPVDWRPNELAAAAAGRPCEVLPLRGRLARTARWHLRLLPRLARAGLHGDVVLNPSGYPNAFGHHPALAFVVHDLHMLQAGFYRRFKRTWFRLWLGRALRRARLVVCPSQHTRGELLRRYPIDPSRCAVVPNALAPALAQAEARPAAAPPYFLAVGTLEPRKNVHRLVDAFAQARAAGLDHRLVLAGRPGHRVQALLRRLAAPDLRDAVEVRGSTSDRELAALYRGATALLFPSLDEGFGLPIVEAMSAGTPVLTSNATATAEVAADAALLVDPLDTAAIRNGILELARDAELQHELRVRGRERAAAFTPRAQACGYERLLAAIDPADGR